MSHVILALALALPAGATSIATDIYDYASDIRYDRAPAYIAAHQRPAYSALVADLAVEARHGQLSVETVDRAAELDLELVERELWVELRPAEPSASAAGVLALRKGPLPAEIVLAAPDPYDELYTGLIASRLFEALPFRGVYLASQSHRAGAASGPAHDEDSALHLATEALSHTLPGATFVQFHGYSERTSQLPAVVSGGFAATPGLLVSRVAELLADALELPGVCTAREEPKLAAEGNVQGRLLRYRAHFLHLALSMEARLLLVDEPERGLAFGAAVVDEASRWGAAGAQSSLRR